MTADPNRWRNAHASEPKSLAGDSIDDYRIEKKLGQGATGSVHKAVALRGPLRGRTIAIKIVGITCRASWKSLTLADTKSIVEHSQATS